MASSRNTIVHSSVASTNYGDIPQKFTFILKGVGNCKIGSIGEGAHIKHMGVGELFISGKVEEDVDFEMTSVGNLVFANRPSPKVIANIKRSSVGDVVMPVEGSKKVVEAEDKDNYINTTDEKSTQGTGSKKVEMLNNIKMDPSATIRIGSVSVGSTMFSNRAARTPNINASSRVGTGNIQVSMLNNIKMDASASINIGGVKVSSLVIKTEDDSPQSPYSSSDEDDNPQSDLPPPYSPPEDDNPPPYFPPNKGSNFSYKKR